MLATNQEIKLKLEQDFAQLQRETKAISDYHSELAARVKETRETLVRLYNSNQTLEQELTRVHTSIKDQMDSVTATSL